MPIGVPRIIYCWGEELPAQWTDIYNFIFRRRMVFLMQYLDDELCNQICGLLINIHMEDRSKELDKKEMENSGVFKSSKSGQAKNESGNIKASQNLSQAPRASKSGKAGGISNPEDLLTSEDDLAIDQNNMLEQYTLQKITMEWLNWNAQFFDYSDPRSGEPYLYYLADILSKDFSKESGNSMYTNSTNFGSSDANTNNKNMLYSTNTLGVNKKFLKLFKNAAEGSVSSGGIVNMGLSGSKKMLKETGTGVSGGSSSNPTTIGSSNTNSSSGFPPATPAQGNSKLATGLEMYYGPFRLLANFAANNTYLPFSLGVEKQTQRALAQREGFTRALGNQGFLKALKNQALGFAKLSKPLTAAQNFGTQNLNGINNSMDFQKDAGQVKEQSFNNNLNKLFTLTGDYAKHKLLNLQGSFPSGSLFPPGPSATANSSKNSILNVLKDQPENALGQRLLKREYLQDRVDSNTGVLKHVKLNKVTKTGNKLSKYSPNPLKRSLGKLDLDSYASMPFGPMGTNQDLSGSLSMANGGLDSLNSYNRKVATKAGNTMGATMSQEEESKKVFVIINSFGGSVGNGITVHDALQFIKAGSLTLGLGVAASAASLVLAGGTIGERYVTEGCHVMIHQPEGGLNGQASDIWIDANEIMKIRLDVAEIYSLSTYRPRHKILRDLDRDFYLTATETISYGLADEIATNEVMSQIVEMTSKAWYEADAQQQRLLESVAHRVDRSSGLDTGSQAAP